MHNIDDKEIDIDLVEIEAIPIEMLFDNLENLEYDGWYTTDIGFVSVSHTVH